MSQTIVRTVQAGQQFSAILKWLNNGSQIWDGSIRAVAQNPASNTTWSASIPSVSGLTLKGQPLEIRLTGVAPRLGGTISRTLPEERRLTPGQSRWARFRQD